MELPIFSGEESERINSFYERLTASAAVLAGAVGGNLIGELHVTCIGDIASLYIDFFGYRGRELVFCRRISDTRGTDGNVIPPPKKVRRQIKSGGGWYTDGTNFYVYDNSFTVGSGAGVRRLEYYKFFPTKRYEDGL